METDTRGGVYWEHRMWMRGDDGPAHAETNPMVLASEKESFIAKAQIYLAGPGFGAKFKGFGEF